MGQGSGKPTSQAKTLDTDLRREYICASQSGCERLRIYRRACGKSRLWEKHVRPNTNGTVEGRLQGTRKIPLAKVATPSAFRRREDVNDSLFPLGWKLASTHKSGVQGARVSLKLPPSFVRLRRSAEDAVLCRGRGGVPRKFFFSFFDAEGGEL